MCPCAGLIDGDVFCMISLWLKCTPIHFWDKLADSFRASVHVHVSVLVPVSVLVHVTVNNVSILKKMKVFKVVTTI